MSPMVVVAALVALVAIDVKQGWDGSLPLAQVCGGGSTVVRLACSSRSMLFILARSIFSGWPHLVSCLGSGFLETLASLPRRVNAALYDTACIPSLVTRVYVLEGHAKTPPCCGLQARSQGGCPLGATSLRWVF